ncbi:MAG TPA: hypothetical protein VEG38_17970 [Acidimicrobiia bacterium]|nr:hypothetical protein [Acidimicrobiia bacterium]
MAEEWQSTVDIRDAPSLPDELLAQLRSAAQTLAQHLEVDVDRAERVVLDSAVELTRDATVVQYAAVLASRRARQRLRVGNGESRRSP